MGRISSDGGLKGRETIRPEKESEITILKPRSTSKTVNILSSRLWDTQVPEEYRKKRTFDYTAHGKSGESLDKQLGERLTTIIHSHVDIVCRQYQILDEELKIIITNSVKCFAFNAMVKNKKLCYDAVWVFISACLNSNFGPDDSYVYMCYIIGYLYPRHYFEPINVNLVKRAHLHAFAHFIEEKCPDLAKKLTCTKTILDCVDCKEETIVSKKPLTAYSKKLGDAYITKMFAAHIDSFAFLKNLDFLFLEGFDYIYRLAIKVVVKLGKNSTHSIKKSMKGLEANESNLIVAAIVSTDKLLKPIQRCDFIKHSKEVYTDKDLEHLVSSKKEEIINGLYNTLNSSIKIARENRLAYLVKTKEDFHAYGVELNEDNLKIFCDSFDEYASNQKINPKGIVCYENVKSHLTKKNGAFHWHINLVNSLYVSIDPKYKGCISSAEFKGILTLLSSISDDNKLYIICGHIEETTDGKVSIKTGQCVLEKLEELIYPNLKGCNVTDGSIVTKTEQHYQNQEMVDLANFLEFSKSLKELTHIYNTPNKLTDYHAKAKGAKENVVYEDPNHSIIDNKSPNLSFNNGEMLEEHEEMSWNPFSSNENRVCSKENCSIY